MRRRVDRARIERVLDAFARAADGPVDVFLVGGTTAVLEGWRDSTIDIDFVLRPDNDALMRALPELKEGLEVNLELASPLDFIPVPPGWEDRSPIISRKGLTVFHHFDLYAQALSKIERGHTQDRADVRELIGRGMVERARLWSYFESIKPNLYRFPAIDPPTFERAVLEAITNGGHPS